VNKAANCSSQIEFGIKHTTHIAVMLTRTGHARTRTRTRTRTWFTRTKTRT